MQLTHTCSEVKYFRVSASVCPVFFFFLLQVSCIGHVQKWQSAVTALDRSRGEALQQLSDHPLIAC